MPPSFLRPDKLSERYWLALSIAMLLAAFVLVMSQATFPPPRGPVPDAPSYTQQAVQMSQGNFISIPPVGEVGQSLGVTVGMHPSRYPPGSSAALLPFAAAPPVAEDGVSIGNAFYVWATVVIAAVCAALLAGSLAAFVAIWLLLGSTFLWSSAYIIMSDCFGALLALIVLLSIILHERMNSSRWAVACLATAGMACGYAVATRLSLIFLLPAALIVVRGWKARGIVVAASIPFLAALAVYQWRVFGSPLTTGYDYWLPGMQEFRLDALWS